jgi:hypothetical protein
MRILLHVFTTYASFTISTNTDALGPVLETPYMQAIQVVHADKNSFLGL